MYIVRQKAVVSDPYAPDANNCMPRLSWCCGLWTKANLSTVFLWTEGHTSSSSGPFIKAAQQGIAPHSMEVASSNMLAASAHLNHLHDAKSIDIIDVAVTCDGTWSNRSVTATHGVVAFIALETGRVLDFKIKSKRCSVCAMQMEQLDEGPNEFDEWWEGNQSHCESNHARSSQAMEISATCDLFQLYGKRLHLWYTEVISNGDTKTVSNLNAVVRPCGKDVTISKHEYVGHVQICVTMRIEAVKKARK